MGCKNGKEATPVEPEAVNTVTAEEDAAEHEKIKAQQNRSRRQGVAAESVDASQLQSYVKPVHPKTETQKEKILETLRNNDKMKVLFGHLEGERLMDVVNAFYTRSMPEGTDIIVQGDQGDSLYIVDRGTVDVFVRRDGQDVPAGDKGPKVVTLGSGALFGELALMYNAPRAATVSTASVVEAFVLNAIDFRMLQAQSSHQQYSMYEGWLKEVDILKTLNHYELAQVADILEQESFEAGEDIVKQGEVGLKFYILEEGTASAYICGDAGEKEVKKYSERGDYFGEIALLTAEPRKATVRATGKGCLAVSLSQEDFAAVLGPIRDILRKHADQYPQYADFLK